MNPSGCSCLTVLRCDGGFVFTVEKKGVCMHVSTSTLKSVFERGGYMRKVVKNEVYIEKNDEHPYISVEGAYTTSYLKQIK